MRLKTFLKEEGEGAGGTGGATTDSTGGTTTNSVEKYWTKILSTPVRRQNVKKKKRKHLPDEYLNDNIFEDFSSIIFCHLNEMSVPEPVYNDIKKVGEKIGFKVKRSDTMFDYLARAEEGLVRIFDLCCLYILANNPTQKEELKEDLKKAIMGVNKRKIIAFFVQLDKFTFGLVALVRRVIQNIFGIEITSYNTYEQDIEYILSHMQKIKEVLWTMSPTEEEKDAYEHLWDVIIKTKEEVERNKKIAKGIQSIF